MNPRLKIGLTTALGLLLFARVDAQQDYFQQEVHYDIAVTLNDELHQLAGQWEMTYTNHSPDTLHGLYLHLWPNAYSDRNTALNRQFLRQGKTELYFADDAELGFIDSLSFSFDDTEHPDVIHLQLPFPLEPGKNVKVSTPFRLQLPSSFSRLGHVGQSYQLTQWFPKVALYDREGWHQMPYLDNGEFYSDFGSYDVHITLPDNYWVAATGVLQTRTEIERLRQKAIEDAQVTFSADDPQVWESPAFPASSTTTKTLHFHADRVHDFAWFADKRFRVRTDTLQLPGGRTVDAWAFFTEEDGHYWEDAIHYIKRSTRYYSERIGEYPYPQVTAVQSTGSAGGGMEYPMITLIGEVYSGYDLDEVITHEVGHNWFYGILGNNERDHAWMDEGLNSWVERAYLSEYYGYQYLLDDWMQGKSRADLNELTYRSLAIRHMDQAPNTTSEDLWEPNYWLGAYDKPAAAFRQLEHWIGRDALDQAMQSFYEQWQFRHPQPEDLQKILEEQTGKDLAWLFDGFLDSNAHQDYAIRGVREQGDSLRVTLTNKGSVQSPFPVSMLKDGLPVHERWVEGFLGTKEILLPKEDFELIQIDPDHLTLEVYRRNNQWHNSLLPSVERPEFRLIAGVANDERQSFFLSPVPGYNHYDGFFLGLGITKRGLLPQSTEWLLAPAYGFQSKSLIGGIGVRQRWWSRENWWREIRLEASLRRASLGYYEPADEFLIYQRFSPSLQIYLQDDPARQRERHFGFRAVNTQQEQLQFSPIGGFLGTAQSGDWLYELSYRHRQKNALSPYRFQIALEQYSYRDAFDRPQDHLKLSVEGRGQFLYQEGRAIHWRLFAGAFVHNSLRTSTFRGRTVLSLFDRGANDYRFDNYYIGRMEQTGLWSRQLARREGGFRAPVSSSFRFGQSNSWLATVNLSADLPITPPWLPIKPYLDAGLFDRIADVSESRFAWVGGLALEWLDGRIGIYLPLAGSAQIMDPLAENGGLDQRIGFRLLLNELAPWQWLDNVFE